VIVNSPPRYARFECPEGDSTLPVHSVAELAGHTGVVVYFECSDLDARVEHPLAAGLEFARLPPAERWLSWEARRAEPSDNVVCLFWAGDNRKNPPWRVAA